MEQIGTHYIKMKTKLKLNNIEDEDLELDD